MRWPRARPSSIAPSTVLNTNSASLTPIAADDAKRVIRSARVTDKIKLPLDLGLVGRGFGKPSRPKFLVRFTRTILTMVSGEVAPY